jgi:hypothetical protein
MKHAFQRISQSLIEMALITGMLLRVLHIFFSTNGDGLQWADFLGTFIILPIVLLALATVHLANYPVKEWLWRAPVFALAEAVVEALFSIALIAVGRERWGTARAEFTDWPAMAGNILMLRLIVVSLFTLVLGAVVQAVRRREFAAERRHHGPPDGVTERRHPSVSTPSPDTREPPEPR